MNFPLVSKQLSHWLLTKSCKCKWWRAILHWIACPRHLWALRWCELCGCFTDWILFKWTQGSKTNLWGKKYRKFSEVTRDVEELEARIAYRPAEFWGPWPGHTYSLISWGVKCESELIPTNSIYPLVCFSNSYAVPTEIWAHVIRSSQTLWENKLYLAGIDRDPCVSGDFGLFFYLQRASALMFLQAVLNKLNSILKTRRKCPFCFSWYEVFCGQYKKWMSFLGLWPHSSKVCFIANPSWLLISWLISAGTSLGGWSLAQLSVSST